MFAGEVDGFFEEFLLHKLLDELGAVTKPERAPIRSTHLQKMTGTRRGEKITEFQI